MLEIQVIFFCFSGSMFYKISSSKTIQILDQFNNGQVATIAVQRPVDSKQDCG